MNTVLGVNSLQPLSSVMKDMFDNTSMCLALCHYDSTMDAFIITPSTEMKFEITTFISGVFYAMSDYIDGKSFKLLNGMEYVDLTTRNTISFTIHEYVYFNIRKGGYITFREGGSGGYKVGDILSPTQYQMINVIKGTPNTVTGSTTVKNDAAWYYGYHNSKRNLLLFCNSNGATVIDLATATVKATNSSIRDYNENRRVFANNEYVYWIVIGNQGYIRTYRWDTLEQVQEVAIGAWIVTRAIAGVRPRHAFVDKGGKVYVNYNKKIEMYPPASSSDYTYSDQNYTQKSVDGGDMVGILYNGSTPVPMMLYATSDNGNTKETYLGPNTSMDTQYIHSIESDAGTIMLGKDNANTRYRYELAHIQDRYCNAICFKQYQYNMDGTTVTSTDIGWLCLWLSTSGLRTTYMPNAPILSKAGFLYSFFLPAKVNKVELSSSLSTSINSQYTPTLPQLIPNGTVDTRLECFDVTNTEGVYVDVRHVNDGSIIITA